MKIDKFIVNEIILIEKNFDIGLDIMKIETFVINEIITID
jgi:hypothetical protein